jgi:shikimate dehydrogenase
MADAALRFGLTGWPLEFSLSPLIHREFFAATGLKGEYTTFPVPPEGFRQTVSLLFSSGISGLNVTYPHKKTAAEMCHELNGSSRDLKTVNTIKIDGEHLCGYNTDVFGFRRFIDLCDLPGPYFIIGSGGAALAADYVLRKSGIKYILFCRDPLKWNGFTSALKLDELNSVLAASETGTVFNATSIGWRDDDVFPADAHLLDGKVFADLNYNASWSWRNDLNDSGVSIFTGETMLVHQAARSFEIWTGIMPETDNVLETVRNWLQERRKGSDTREY